jgi:hypothetical protein
LTGRSQRCELRTLNCQPAPPPLESVMEPSTPHSDSSQETAPLWKQDLVRARARAAGLTVRHVVGGYTLGPRGGKRERFNSLEALLARLDEVEPFQGDPNDDARTVGGLPSSILAGPTYLLRAYEIGTLIEMIPEEMALTQDQKENVAHALEYFRILLREGMSRSEAFERASQHLDFIERQANNETIGKMQSVFAELTAEIT